VSDKADFDRCGRWRSWVFEFNERIEWNGIEFDSINEEFFKPRRLAALPFLLRRNLDFRRGQSRYLMSRQGDDANRPVFVLSAWTIARRDNENNDNDDAERRGVRGIGGHAYAN